LVLSGSPRVQMLWVSHHLSTEMATGVSLGRSSRCRDDGVADDDDEVDEAEERPENFRCLVRAGSEWAVASRAPCWMAQVEYLP
jgi:hypothetical protein